jgi:hypothetical protein
MLSIVAIRVRKRTRTLSQYATTGEGTQAQSNALLEGRGEEIPRRPQPNLVVCFVTNFFETRHLICLGALTPLDDVKLNLITLFEALISLALDGAIVNKDVRPALAAEETVTLRVVEPLYSASILCHWSYSLNSCLRWAPTAK